MIDYLLMQYYFSKMTKLYTTLSLITVLNILLASTPGQCNRTTNFTHVSNVETKIGVELLQVLDKNFQSLTSAKNSVTLLWHGMGDTASGSISVLGTALRRNFPGMPILSVQIGSSATEDMLASYFVNVNHQVDKVCQALLNNTLLKDHGSLNMVGFSQGAQFLRALIQRCPFSQSNIKVKSLISLGGQHQGVYGLPHCVQKQLCQQIRHLLSQGVYEDTIQEHLVQAEYWHDPLMEDLYKRKSIFLADINNELNHNEVYRKNLLQLDNMVLVMFTEDSMVIPKESSLFGYYKPGSTKEIILMNETTLYKEDKIGLKALERSGRLRLIKMPGDHLQFKINWFIDEIAKVYLDN